MIKYTYNVIKTITGSDLVNFNEHDNILEEDLSEPIQNFLIENGYTVRCEANFCDISATKDNILLVVELKKNLSVKLLTQAVKRQKIADLVYIAIPKPKKMTTTSGWKDICHLLRRLELGLMLVSFKGEDVFVEIPIEPIPFDRIKSIQRNKQQRNKLLAEMKGRKKNLNRGGSKGKKLMTAYRESSLYIACCLEKSGPLSPKQLKEFGTDSKKTQSILNKNFYNWFEKVDRGLYQISEEGKKSLNIYKELSDYYFKKL